MKKIVVAGATGTIGKKLTSKLIERGDEVTILTRSTKRAIQIIPDAASYIEWSTQTKNWYKALAQKDAVINLAGENIMAKRWTETHKRNIISSRVETTRLLVEAIESVDVKPKIFISASAVGYYGNSEAGVDETSPAGTGFLTNVVEQWERASSGFDANIRRVNTRIGIILDKESGALAKMIPTFKFFLGGSLGSGNQWFSWIHIADVIGIFIHAVDNENVNGVINAVSPNTVRMKEFCKELGKVMHRPSAMTVPSLILKIILGEAAGAILEGAKVMPVKAKAMNYKFIYPELEPALKNLLCE